MRTNIELDDDLMAEAAKYSNSKSKRGIVAEALAEYIAVRAKDKRKESYRERLQHVRNITAGLRTRSSSHDIIKNDRLSR